MSEGILEHEGVVERPSWDEYFIGLLDKLALRSTCLRRQVASIIVKNNRIVATGYNGQPPGVKHCIDKGFCLREKLNVPSGQRAEICFAVHAEENAILQAVNLGTNLEGSTMYVFASPCSYCTKSILSVGISRVVYLNTYPDELAKKLREKTPWVKWEEYKPPLKPEENILLYKDEKVRRIKGFDSYHISDYGRVFKDMVFDPDTWNLINTGIWIEPRYDTTKKEAWVTLKQGGETCERLTCELVAETWLDKKESDKLGIIDGNRQHAHVDNLKVIKNGI